MVMMLAFCLKQAGGPGSNKRFGQFACIALKVPVGAYKRAKIAIKNI